MLKGKTTGKTGHTANDGMIRKVRIIRGKTKEEVAQRVADTVNRAKTMDKMNIKVESEIVRYADMKTSVVIDGPIINNIRLTSSHLEDYPYCQVISVYIEKNKIKY